MIDVIGTLKTWYPSSEPSVVGSLAYPAFSTLRWVKASSFTITTPPGSTLARSAFRAAGFIATSTSAWSPGVVMSVDANWIWNAETPCTVPAGARISAGKSGRVARSLPSTAVARGESVAGELHAVARVPGESDDDAFPLFDGLGHA